MSQKKKTFESSQNRVAKSILETIISVKTFREDAKHAMFFGLISPKLITLSVSIGHCPLKGFVKQRCTALERAMARGPRFFSGCFVSFLLFFFPSSARFARSLTLLYTRVRPSREEFLKINIGAKRGGAAKKIRYPLRLRSFLPFLASLRFFSATRIAQSRASSPYGPQREGWLFESTRSSRKRIHEGSGNANLRALKKRGRIYFLRSVARPRYSLCRYRLNNFILLYTSRDKPTLKHERDQTYR